MKFSKSCSGQGSGLVWVWGWPLPGDGWGRGCVGRPGTGDGPGGQRAPGGLLTVSPCPGPAGRLRHPRRGHLASGHAGQLRHPVLLLPIAVGRQPAHRHWHLCDGHRLRGLHRGHQGEQMPSAHRESSGGAGQAGGSLDGRTCTRTPTHVPGRAPPTGTGTVFCETPPPGLPPSSCPSPLGPPGPCAGRLGPPCGRAGRAAEAGGLARSSSWHCCWCSCSRPASPSSSSPTLTRYSCPAAGLGLHPPTGEGTGGAEN